MKKPNAYPGSFGGGVTPAGFARYAPKGYAAGMQSGGYGWAMKRTGFAADIAAYHEDAAYDDRRTKPTSRARRFDASKQRPETYPWPNMVVSALINKSEAGADWRKFDKTLEARARSIGRSVGLKNFQVVIIGAPEWQTAMNEKHSSAARDSDDDRRKRLVEKTCSDVNGIIEDLAYEEQNQHWVNRSPAEERLWSSGSVMLGTQDGYGPNGIGLKVEDEENIFAKRKTLLVSRVCSELGFNPVHFTPLEEPTVLMVDTSPLPVDGLYFTIPPGPYDMPVKTARAYGPAHQAAKLSMMV